MYTSVMSDNTQNDDKDDQKVHSQPNADGDDVFIKDPIYDIMSDEEIAARSEGLMELLDEYNDKTPDE